MQEPIPFVISLIRAQGSPAELVGGKAAQLAELAALGLPVPPAFCITTAAYRSFLSTSGLAEWLADSLRQISPTDLPRVMKLASEIRERFAAQPIPGEVAEAIQGGYDDLCGGENPCAVAVRSSATAEDGLTTSFAGQCETSLNVTGTSALLDAVVACWASLYSEKALLYRARQDLHGLECATGVVVQHLVPADRAAIVFSANPIDGDRSFAVVNASWGLGEAIVGGLVNPDQYLVFKDGLAIHTRQVADKRLMTVPLPNGGTAELPVPVEHRQLPSLTDSEIQELVDLAVRLEDTHGCPVDIECAYRGPKLAVLQCRPITAL